MLIESAVFGWHSGGDFITWVNHFGKFPIPANRTLSDKSDWYSIQLIYFEPQQILIVFLKLSEFFMLIVTYEAQKVRNF